MKSTRILSLVIACAVVLTTQNLHAAGRFVPDANYEYSLIECTKGEFVAAGSDDNVLRWSGTQGNEQRWRFVKADRTKYPNKYHIQCMKNGKYLDVQWTTGNVAIYPNNGKVEQTFTLWKLDEIEADRYVPEMYKQYRDLGVDFIMIYESTRDGERVAVGSNGNLVRWSPVNDKTQVFIARKERQSANPYTKYFSFGKDLYQTSPDASGNYAWTLTDSAPFERTVINPLDGGVFFTYRQNSIPGASDGCSAGDPDNKKLFLKACFAHDTNLDIPFDLAGFPKFKNGNGQSCGKDIADYLFFQDMLLIAEQTFRDDAFKKNWAETVADFWYRGVQIGGPSRGGSAGKGIVSDINGVPQHGGVVAVKNTGGYVMRLKVTWTSPKNARIAHQAFCTAGFASTIPLSLGSRNITIECWAEGGNKIIDEMKASTGMYAYTVGGTTLDPTLLQGLR